MKLIVTILVVCLLCVESVSLFQWHDTVLLHKKEAKEEAKDDGSSKPDDEFKINLEHHLLDKR